MYPISSVNLVADRPSPACHEVHGVWRQHDGRGVNDDTGSCVSHDPFTTLSEPWGRTFKVQRNIAYPADLEKLLAARYVTQTPVVINEGAPARTRPPQTFTGVLRPPWRWISPRPVVPAAPSGLELEPPPQADTIEVTRASDNNPRWPVRAWTRLTSLPALSNLHSLSSPPLGAHCMPSDSQECVTYPERTPQRGRDQARG